MSDLIVFNGEADTLEKQDFSFVSIDYQHFPETQIRNTNFAVPAWNFSIILTIFVIIVLNKYLVPNKFRGIMSIFFEGSHSDKVLREWSPLNSITGLSAFVSYLLLATLFIQKIIAIFTEEALYYSTLSNYIEIFYYVAAFYVFQYLFITFHGWIFQVESNAQRHITLHLSLMSSYNIFLIFIILVLLFYPFKVFCVIGGIVLFIPFCIRIFRTFIELQTFSNLNFVNIFLYLCTLEILPLAVVVKMGIRLIHTGWVI